MTLSVILNTYNEAHLLEDCLKSVKNFADEIVVSDMQSKDESVAIAKNMGCIVFVHEPKPFVEATLIPRIEKCTGDWILMLDPDMRIPEHTAKKIRQVIHTNKADAYTFYMRNYIFGKLCSHGHASGGRFFKLYKRKDFLENKHLGTDIFGGGVLNAIRKKRIKHLPKEYYIEHIAYDDMYQMFQQHIRYADSIAKKKIKQGKKFSWIRVVGIPVKKFFQDFIIRKAWKDGVPGMSYTLAASIMYFFTELLIWYYNRFNKDEE